MSSTYRDAPGWVRMMRDPARLVREVHDHRGGECILPAEFKDAEDCGYDGAGCYYGPTPEFYCGKGGGCPCWMCHDAYGNRASNRRRRRAEAVLCVALAKCAPEELEGAESALSFQRLWARQYWD
jgi:hypothetical protein